MKERNHNLSKDNVIHFPDLEKRLLERGQEQLERKNYREAISLFEQAVKINPSSGDCHLGLVLSLFGAGMMEKAIHFVERMLNEGIGNYFEIMDLYLMLLSQINKHAEIVTAIEGLLAEKSIPGENLENYYSMLNYSRKMMEIQLNVESEQSANDLVTNSKLDLWELDDTQEQLMLVAKLANANIQPYLSEMISYLEYNEEKLEKHGVLFFKTLLLNVLKEHGYDHPIEIHKLGKVMGVIPKNLPDIYENQQLTEIIHLISQEVEQEDPVLFDSIRTLINRQFFLLYPFQLEMLNSAVWAAAYHTLGNEYFGNHHTLKKLMEKYQVLESELHNAYSFISRIEEISYPNIDA